MVLYPHASYLTNEEVDYELWLRGRREDINKDLDSKHRLLRNLFYEDTKENRTYESSLTFQEEYENSVNQFDTLNKKFERTRDENSLSRMQHYLMRIERSRVTDQISAEARAELVSEMRAVLNSHRKRGGHGEVPEQRSNPGSSSNNLKVTDQRSDPVPSLDTQQMSEQIRQLEASLANLGLRLVECTNKYEESKRRSDERQRQYEQRLEEIRNQSRLDSRDGLRNPTPNRDNSSRNEPETRNTEGHPRDDHRTGSTPGTSRQGDVQRNQRDDQGRSQHQNPSSEPSRRENPRVNTPPRRDRRDTPRGDSRADSPRRMSPRIESPRRHNPRLGSPLHRDSRDEPPPPYSPGHRDHRSNLPPRHNSPQRPDPRSDYSHSDHASQEINRQGSRYPRVNSPLRRDPRVNSPQRRHPRDDSIGHQSSRFNSPRRRSPHAYSPRRHGPRDDAQPRRSRSRERNGNRDRGNYNRNPGDTSDDSRRRDRNGRDGDRPDRRNAADYSSDDYYGYSDEQYHRRPRGYRGNRNGQIHNADRRMEKWHVTFDGDPRHRSLEDFLHKVQRLADMDNIPNDILFRRIHTILRDGAYDWYLCYANEFQSWEDFERKIRYMFGNPNRDQGNRQKIYERKQQRNESFLLFKMEIERLNKLLTNPLGQERIFEVIWDNMRPHYKSRLACRPVRDLPTLEYYAYRIDANDPALRQTRDPAPRNVHNVEVEDDEQGSYSESEEVNAIGGRFGRNRRPREEGSGPNRPQANASTPTKDPPKFICWNCRKPGHLWRDCRLERTVFCYTCGAPDQMTNSCDNHRGSTQRREQENAGN